MIRPVRLDVGTIRDSLPEGILHPRPTVFEWTVTSESLSDTVAHVNNVTYLQWVDRIAELAGEVLGHTREQLAADHRMWFVARHEIDYLAEAFEHDLVRAGTWILDARKTSCRRETLLWTQRSGGSQPIARALSTWTWMDLERRRPCRMPAGITSLLDPLHDGVAEEEGTSP